MTRLPLVLTQGDPSGVGPDITLVAWMRRTPATPPFYVVADADLLRRRASRLGLAARVVETSPAEAVSVFGDGLPVVPLRGPVEGEPGTPSVKDAAATLQSIEVAVRHVRQGLAGGVVTNPIAKHVLYQAGFTHPGHTEFLGVLAERLWHIAPSPRPVMMLWCEDLAVVPVTVHIPLRDVPVALTAALLHETATIVAADLRRRFGIARPRLACAGLNPHAGESGSMGRDEIDLIGPALERLRHDGIEISGPHPADTLFTAAARSRYDAALAMYHDQALIPIKTLAFDEAVNVTLGLPFVRTSPDHGTAFDIAGTGAARPTSLLAAIGLAARLTANTDPRQTSGPP